MQSLEQGEQMLSGALPLTTVGVSVLHGDTGSEDAAPFSPSDWLRLLGPLIVLSKMARSTDGNVNGPIVPHQVQIKYLHSPFTVQ